MVLREREQNQSLVEEVLFGICYAIIDLIPLSVSLLDVAVLLFAGTFWVISVDLVLM